jgi:hypothetical protein
MGGRFSLVIARAGNSLTGQWKPIENYKNTCPPIQARLNMDKEQKITDSMLQAIRNSKENFKYWAAEPNEKNQSITSNAPNETGTPPSPTSSLNSTQPSPKNTEGTPNTSKNTNSVPVKNNTSSPANTRTDQNAAGQKSNWAAGKNGKRAADKKAERAIRKKTSGDKNKQTTNPPEQTTDDNIVTDPNRVASTTTEKHKKDRKFHLFNRNPSHGEKNEKSIDLYSRPIEVASEVEVEMDTVLISLYDNGETDGDSVSVFFNKKRVVSNHLLSARPFQLKVPLDSLDEYVELTVFAENLGKYPPNTAVMVVNAGDKNYKVVLTSSLEKSASVRIKRKRTGLRIR